MADVKQSPVVLFTSEHALAGELFSYIYAHVAACPPDVRVMAVRSASQPLARRVVRSWKKACKLGLAPALEIISSNWIRRGLGRREQQEIEQRIRRLPRPSRLPDAQDIRWVSSANGQDAVRTLEALDPAILVQAGAGILRSCVFQVPAWER